MQIKWGEVTVRLEVTHGYPVRLSCSVKLQIILWHAEVGNEKRPRNRNSENFITQEKVKVKMKVLMKFWFL